MNPTDEITRINQADQDRIAKVPASTRHTHVKPANPRRLFGRCFNGLAVRYCLARFRATKDGQWRTAARHWILNMG
ncbi:MAG: hypothetical protein BWY57_02996 [Betaproteobacteria bacterium ADurb.Bin341]|nr:MAG: hypothetical protein BWY57_02996 [Betaproteobacteria bacterium ADurb.Bin341]